MHSDVQEKPGWRRALSLVVAAALVLGLSPVPQLAGKAYAEDGASLAAAPFDTGTAGEQDAADALEDGTLNLDEGIDATLHSLAKFCSLLLACNKANCRFRWVKFYLDDDNDIVANADVLIDEYTVGEECAGIVSRIDSIIDDAYPDFMRAMWA